MVLAFATRPYGPNGPPTPETLAMVSGIISQGPLVHLTYPAAKVLRLIAAGLSRIAPGLPFPAPMPEEVCLVPSLPSCSDMSGGTDDEAGAMRAEVLARPGRQRATCERPAPETARDGARAAQHAHTGASGFGRADL